MLWRDFHGPTLRRLALAGIYDGGRRGDAARIGGVGLQIVRDWVVRFNARGPDGLDDGNAPGQRAKFNDAQRDALVDIVESGPILAIQGVMRCRLIELAQWLYAEFGVLPDETSIGRVLKKRRSAELSARPRHHAQNELVMEDLKKGLCSRAGSNLCDPRARHAVRNLTPRLGQNRSEKQDNTTLGQARNAALGTQRSTDCLNLYLRRHPP